MKVCQTDQSDRSIVVHITVTGSVTSRLEYRQPQLLLIDSFDKKNIFWPRPCSRCNIAMFLVGWFEVDSRKYQEKKKITTVSVKSKLSFHILFLLFKTSNWHNSVRTRRVSNLTVPQSWQYLAKKFLPIPCYKNISKFNTCFML